MSNLSPSSFSSPESSSKKRSILHPNVKKRIAAFEDEVIGLEWLYFQSECHRRELDSYLQEALKEAEQWDIDVDCLDKTVLLSSLQLKRAGIHEVGITVQELEKLHESNLREAEALRQAATQLKIFEAKQKQVTCIVKHCPFPQTVPQTERVIQRALYGNGPVEAHCQANLFETALSNMKNEVTKIPGRAGQLRISTSYSTELPSCEADHLQPSCELEKELEKLSEEGYGQNEKWRANSSDCPESGFLFREKQREEWRRQENGEKNDERIDSTPLNQSDIDIDAVKYKNPTLQPNKAGGFQNGEKENSNTEHCNTDEIHGIHADGQCNVNPPRIHDNHEEEEDARKLQLKLSSVQCCVKNICHDEELSDESDEEAMEIEEDPMESENHEEKFQLDLKIYIKRLLKEKGRRQAVASYWERESKHVQNQIFRISETGSCPRRSTYISFNSEVGQVQFFMNDPASCLLQRFARPTVDSRMRIRHRHHP